MGSYTIFKNIYLHFISWVSAKISTYLSAFVEQSKMNLKKEKTTSFQFSLNLCRRRCKTNIPSTFFVQPVCACTLDKKIILDKCTDSMKSSMRNSIRNSIRNVPRLRVSSCYRSWRWCWPGCRGRTSPSCSWPPPCPARPPASGSRPPAPWATPWSGARQPGPPHWWDTQIYNQTVSHFPLTCNSGRFLSVSTQLYPF